MLSDAVILIIFARGGMTFHIEEWELFSHIYLLWPIEEGERARGVVWNITVRAASVLLLHMHARLKSIVTTRLSISQLVICAFSCLT